MIILYAIGGVVGVVVVGTWVAQAIWGDEAVDRFTGQVQTAGSRLQEVGCMMIVTITVPVLVAFVVPWVGIPLLAIGVVAFVAWLGQSEDG